MRHYFADLHIHIGRDIYSNPVKITASNSLTLTNILMEASRNKGIDIVGIIDCQSPTVLEELKELILQGGAKELPGGGIRFEKVTLICGSEIEVYDENCLGPIHVLCYLPTLKRMEQFSEWLEGRMKNRSLSSQRYYGNAKDLQYKVKELGGMFMPAHVFTPFKGLYGNGVKSSMREVLDPDLVDAVELGLSSDTMMADSIQELHGFSYMTNSDAHSLPKIAREYQEFLLEDANFNEIMLALHRVDGRRITRNFGMNPLLGKYHTTVCTACLHPWKTGTRCDNCGSAKMTKGVAERIGELAAMDPAEAAPDRPPYLYQVPLEYLPSLGPKTYQKLLGRFGTEMQVIHHATMEDLAEIVPSKISRLIIDMRNNRLEVHPGGGGKYGNVSETPESH